MSKSNTFYWNICGDSRSRWLDPDWNTIGEDGYCGWHRAVRFRGAQKKCIPSREIAGRETWTRKSRFPRYSWKSIHKGPPRSMKRIWQRRLRHLQDRQIRQYGEVRIDANKRLAGYHGNWA